MNIYRFAKKVLRLYYRLTKPLTVGVRIILGNESNQVLLVKHADDGKYYIPGGGVRKSESLKDACIREVSEECGIHISDPRVVCAYSNFQEYKNDHIVLFYAEIPDTDIKTDSREITDAGFYSVDQLPENMSNGSRRRIDEFSESGFTCGLW